MSRITKRLRLVDRCYSKRYPPRKHEKVMRLIARIQEYHSYTDNSLQERKEWLYEINGRIGIAKTHIDQALKKEFNFSPVVLYEITKKFAEQQDPLAQKMLDYADNNSKLELFRFNYHINSNNKLGIIENMVTRTLPFDVYQDMLNGFEKEK